MSKIIISITILFFLAGCAIAPAVRPTIQDTKIINAPFDKVWSAIVATLSERALPIKTIEKENGVITTDFVIFASGSWAEEAIDKIAVKPSCFPWFFCFWDGGRYTVSIFATKDGESTTRVKITTHIEAFEKYLTPAPGKWMVCYSNGTIERQIFTDVKAKIW